MFYYDDEMGILNLQSKNHKSSYIFTPLKMIGLYYFLMLKHIKKSVY